MFSYPPPLLSSTNNSKQLPSTTPNQPLRPSSTLSSSSSSGDSGCSPGTNITPDRYLPSLLTAPFLSTTAVQSSSVVPPPAAVAPNAALPNQGIQSLLHHTASLMAANAQLRKEIEQVRAMKSISTSVAESLVAPTSLPPFFLSSDTVGATVSSALLSNPSIVSLLPFQNANARLPPPGRKSPLPDTYKTVMCQAWLEASQCSFGENCRFAHGEHELRPVVMPTRQNRKYKTKLCDKYTNTGLCPYGNRCLFIHPDIGNNAYIRADKLEELKKKQEERKQIEEKKDLVHNEENVEMMVKNAMMVDSTPTTHRPRAQLRPHPSWPLEPDSFFGPSPLLNSFAALKQEDINKILETVVKRSEEGRLNKVCQDIRHETSTPPTLMHQMSTGSTGSSMFTVSSGYSSDSRTPSETSSGSASPLQLLSGVSSSSPVSSSVTLPLITSSSTWPCDPFEAAIDYDNIAREMAKEIGL